jgi:hypothetical protein
MLTEGAQATDTFATLIGPISDNHMDRLHRMVQYANWREIAGRQYDTADVSFWEPCTRAFFIRIPPGGSIPRHHDVFIPGTTHHLVVQSNKDAWNYWLDTKGQEQRIHMETGYRYRVAREPLHWATNDGQEDRIHLLVEYPWTTA